MSSDNVMELKFRNRCVERGGVAVRTGNFLLRVSGLKWSTLADVSKFGQVRSFQSAHELSSINE